MRKLFLLVILFACSLRMWGQADFSQIDSLIKRMLPESSEVGISIYDLTDNKSLYTYQETKLCRPASTMKLLTAITALSHPDAREPFRTEVWYKGTVRKGVLRGDLYVVGGFDPEFDEKSMETLVEKIRSFPISVIKGRVYGDVTMKDSLYWGSGWIWDDNPATFQPYLSPLMFCKGVVRVTASPGIEEGQPAELTCQPVSSYYKVINKTVTASPEAGRFAVTRDWMRNQNDLIVKGNVETNSVDGVNIFSSQDLFMHSLVDGLRAKGIKLKRPYAFGEFNPDEASVHVATIESPVQTVLEQMLKESDNLNAEAMLCRLGKQATGKKYISESDGITEINKLLTQLGYAPDQYRIADGCGLSNYDYLSPQLLVDALKFAYSKADIYPILYESLPIAGVDGTLKNRMKDTPAYQNVRAKTGSYTAINTLAGFLTMQNGHRVAFAIMNQNILSASQARAFQDKVCELICLN